MVLTESMKMAAFTGNAAEVTAFLEKNPEGVDDVDEQGRTMMETAMISSVREPERALAMMRLLISRGAEVDRRSGPGTPSTALHEASLRCWPEAVETLIQAGADVNAVCGGHRGDRPPSLALGLVFSAHWLREDSNLAEQSGRTLEQVLHNMYQIMPLLLRAGHPLDYPLMGTMGGLERRIEWMIPRYTGDAPYLNDALELARAVRAAQSTSTSTRLTPWQKYCLAPPKELLRLRSLVARGRAKERKRLRAKTPRESSLLFAPAFPNELFWKVIAFWNPRY